FDYSQGAHSEWFCPSRPGSKWSSPTLEAAVDRLPAVRLRESQAPWPVRRSNGVRGKRRGMSVSVPASS
ncbi:hypothetical protein C8Q80DRAFT_1192225, partial [Daedaleopsis nitida]